MKPTKEQVREAARDYLKVVEWSREDQCFIGSAPPLVGRSCHGKSEPEVFAQLGPIVEEWVAALLEDGRPLPKGTAKKKYSGRFVVRLSPELHRKVALKAMAKGDSLNEFVSEALSRT